MLAVSMPMPSQPGKCEGRAALKTVTFVMVPVVAHVGRPMLKNMKRKNCEFKDAWAMPLGPVLEFGGGALA